MKKRMVITIILLVIVFVTGTAYAGVFDSVKSWLSNEILALAITVVTLAMSTVFGVLFGRVSKTLKEAGEFLAVIGEALADGRVNKDELKQIFKEGRDVFDLWKKTPEKYTA